MQGRIPMLRGLRHMLGARPPKPPRPQQPLIHPTLNRFYHFWFFRVIAYFLRTIKKTKKHTLLTSLLCSQILLMTYYFLLPLHHAPSPLFLLPFFPFPCFHLFFLSIFSLFLFFSLFFSSFSVFPFPSSKNLRRLMRAPWGARPPEARGLRPVPFVPLRGSGTGS